MQFTKLDKKLLGILVIILAVVLAGTFFGYKYLTSLEPESENSIGGASIENFEPETKNPAGEEEKADDLIDVQIKTDQPVDKGLSVCADQCGNGVCQKADPECDKNSLNCVCGETPQDCPQDCK